MKNLLKVVALLTATACSTATFGAEVVVFDEPISTSLLPNTVICSNPESLFLLYESTRFVKTTQPPESTEPTAFFERMFDVVKSNGACSIQPAEYAVKVTSVTVFANSWKRSNSMMVYGEFQHPALQRKTYAPLLALPGLSKHFEQMAARTEQEAGPTGKQ